MSTTLNLAIFGIGNVGSTLLKQIASYHKRSKENFNATKINVFIIANSKLALFSDLTVSNTWKTNFETDSYPYTMEDIFSFKEKLEANGQNISDEQFIAVDLTASPDFVKQYIPLIEHGFHIVTANKIANSLYSSFYVELREALDIHKKQFHYETNVGAGLPIIETIKNLHRSGEEIQKIRGVFSGSLSYLFNTFSKEEKEFSEILLEADALGLTEPDVREDLSGKDVARKLLILGRELGLTHEFEDVNVQSLVPQELNGQTTLPQFHESIKKLNAVLAKSKNSLGEGEVLRHVGELDLKTERFEVKLVQESVSTALGQIKGADAVFEIYTKSYGDQPLVIQGAGAGKAVTARGVLGDILKIAHSYN
jgi:homoserine dehydrogenase